MSAKSFFLGVLVGGAVGAGIGMLFAPEEGHETRRKITDATKVARNKASGYATNVKDKVRTMTSAIRPSM